MNFKERFPELWSTMSASQTRSELTKICRSIAKQIDTGTLEISYCDGAFLAFKEELLAQWRTESTRTYSPAEARANRILTISDSDGKRKARRMC